MLIGVVLKIINMTLSLTLTAIVVVVFIAQHSLPKIMNRRDKFRILNIQLAHDS